MESIQNALEVEGIKGGAEMAPSIEGNIDINKEWSLMAPEFIVNHLSVKEVENKVHLYLAGERVLIRFSKKGFVYFMVGKSLIRGSARQALISVLFQLCKPTSYVGKLGKYEVEVGLLNGKELYFCFSSEGLSFIASKDAIERMATEMSYREDFEAARTTDNGIQVPEISHEAYGDSEASLGWLYVENLLEQLEKASDLIAIAKQSGHPEVAQKLQEIKELLRD